MLYWSIDIRSTFNSIIINLLKSDAILNDTSYLFHWLAEECRLVKQHNMTFISEPLNLYYLITRKTKCSDN